MPGRGGVRESASSNPIQCSGEGELEYCTARGVKCQTTRPGQIAVRRYPTIHRWATDRGFGGLGFAESFSHNCEGKAHLSLVRSALKQFRGRVMQNDRYFCRPVADGSLL